MGEQEGKRKWAGNTFGNGWMHSSLVWMLKYIDYRFFYAFVAVFVLPFCLVFSKGSRHIYRYYRERRGCGRCASVWGVWKNLLVFSQVVIDKFAIYAGVRFKIETDNKEAQDYLLGRSDGFVQLSAHVGNYEAAGYQELSDQKRINALVFFGEKESVMSNRSKLFGATNVSMIPMMADGSHVFAIDEALVRGEIVSAPADRVFGSPKTITKKFMGAEARFPIGPFQMAGMRGMDVLTLNVMKVNATTYKAYFKMLEYDKGAPRRRQVEEISEGYVSELERILEMYPEQWFNYFDFWNQ